MKAVRNTGPTVERGMKSGRVPDARNEWVGLAVQRAAATLVESRRHRASEERGAKRLSRRGEEGITSRKGKNRTLSAKVSG